MNQRLAQRSTMDSHCIRQHHRRPKSSLQRSTLNTKHPLLCKYSGTLTSGHSFTASYHFNSFHFTFTGAQNRLRSRMLERRRTALMALKLMTYYFNFILRNNNRSLSFDHPNLWQFCRQITLNISRGLGISNTTVFFYLLLSLICRKHTFIIHIYYSFLLITKITDAEKLKVYSIRV